MLKMMVLSLAVSALATGAAAAEHRITMAGSDYAPATVEAKVGETLVFENNDTEAHNVFVPTVAFSTDLGKQDPGKSARLQLTKPGSFEVECVIHQDMNMRVTVKP
jgi:plastocyanin